MKEKAYRSRQNTCKGLRKKKKSGYIVIVILGNKLVACDLQNQIWQDFLFIYYYFFNDMGIPQYIFFWRVLVLRTQ